jgi:CheY-like chemotaxis protein
MTREQEEIGRIENEARFSNETVSVAGEDAHLIGKDALAILCECGDRSCHEPLVMNVDEYEQIRSQPAQFAVIAGHELPIAERVVVRHEHYLIVEKYGAAGMVADAADPRNHLKTCRVVVVDEVPEVRQLLTLLIAAEPSCMLVGEASDAEEAVELVMRTQPEIVVMDLGPDTMEGWQTLYYLCRSSPTTHVIVYSSAAIDVTLEKRLVNIGADRIVRKTGDPGAIMHALRDVALSGRDRSFSSTDEQQRIDDV